MNNVATATAVNTEPKSVVNLGMRIVTPRVIRLWLDAIKASGVKHERIIRRPMYDKGLFTMRLFGVYRPATQDDLDRIKNAVEMAGFTDVVVAPKATTRHGYTVHSIEITVPATGY